MAHELLNFTRRRRLPVIRQAEAAECGLACLAMIACYYGHDVDLNTLRRRYPVSLKGVTLRALIQIAGNLNLVCRPLRLEPAHLPQLRLPAVLHWDMNHFVVLQAVLRKEIVVHDPACGKKRYSLVEASKHFTGVALEVLPAPGFEPNSERVRLPLRAFWGRTAGIGHALMQILLLSIVLEALVIAAPFYMQLAVDEVIARGDLDFLTILGLGFGLLMLIRVASTAIRSQVILIVQSTLHYHIGLRLFHHLVRLPLVYFEKRHIGDLLSRFTSIEPIRNLFAEGLIAAAIDGLMAVATLAMLFVYSARLAGIVVAATLAYALLRLGLYRVFRERSETVIQNKAREDSIFIETMRAMQSLKLFNREGERENQWLHRHADVVNANVGLGRARISFKMANDLIFGVENIVVIYLAARLALDNVLTIGMIFAFVSYKLSFTDKAVQLIEKALDFRILDLHLERLADIALNPPERGHDQALTHQREINGGIELKNVCFRYAESEPLVLENINLRVEPGRVLTIVGPSGSGKTTLVKIMLGLLEPTSGDVLIDGLPLQTIGARAFREQIGAVMQEDQLLSGSIADNICFFDPAFDHEWMVECAQLAGIHDEIMAMPMAYNSLIGDMGSSLSGGQKQRVLLARALYRRPKILFLDEGTAHLDVEMERLINENLARLDIARINIAHRPGVIGSADAVFRVGAVNQRPAARRARSLEPAAPAATRSSDTNVAPDGDTPTDRTPSRRRLRALQGVAIVVVSGFLIAADFPASNRLLNGLGDHAGRLITMLLDELRKDERPLLAQSAAQAQPDPNSVDHSEPPLSTGGDSQLGGNHVTPVMDAAANTDARPEGEHAGAELTGKPIQVGSLPPIRESAEPVPQSSPSEKTNNIAEALVAPDAKPWVMPEALSPVPTVSATTPPVMPAEETSLAATSTAAADAAGLTAPTAPVPPDSKPAPPVMPAPGQPRLSTEEIAALLARGDAAFAAGDVASARLFYQRAADAGDGQAAVRLGRTFDPGILSHARHHAVNGDPDRALAWYRRAAELGVSDTGVPLKTLKAN